MIITVFGATGKQGGSVIRAILEDAALSNMYKIRGITRDASKPAAQELSKKGVEVVSADLNSVASLAGALTSTDVVFLVTNYWENLSGDVEFAQGKNVTDVAKKVGVSHIIFSSLPHVADTTKGRLSNVPHFDSKANVEKYIRASGLKATFVLVGYYMNNLTQMLTKSADGRYTLFTPVDTKKALYPLIDTARDTGLFVKAVLRNRDSLAGKQILAAADYYSAEDIVTTFAKVTRKTAVAVQVTAEKYKALMPGATAVEYLESHQFMEDPGYFLGASLEPSLKLLDAKPTTWAEFVEKNAAAWP